jgi:hypothetical protein
MPTYANLAVDNKPDTDAEWQAWCQAIEAAFLASGFLELAPDTGQLDLTTTVRPALGTWAGFRMYRAQDDFAATKPFYVKVEYGVTGSGQDRPIIRRTSATGSNGSGTLTGPTSAVTASSNSSAGSGAAQIYGGGGDHAAFVYQRDPGNAGHTIFWSAGRFLDQEDGSASDPIIWDNMSSGAGSSFYGTYIYTDGSAAWLTLGSGAANHFPELNALVNSGGNMNFTRVFQGLIYRNGKTLVWPALNGKSAELPFTNPEDSKFTLNIWGGTHTFLPIPETPFANSGNRLCMLWED